MGVALSLCMRRGWQDAQGGFDFGLTPGENRARGFVCIVVGVPPSRSASLAADGSRHERVQLTFLRFSDCVLGDPSQCRYIDLVRPPAGLLWVV